MRLVTSGTNYLSERPSNVGSARGCAIGADDAGGKAADGGRRSDQRSQYWIYSFPRGAGGLGSGHSATQHSCSVSRGWQRGRGQRRWTRRQRCRLRSPAPPVGMRQADDQYGTVIGTELSRLRHQREPGRQHESDRPRAPRRADVSRPRARIRFWPGRLPSAHLEGDPGATYHRRYQAFRLSTTRRRDAPRPTQSSTSAAGARATCWRSKSA